MIRRPNPLPVSCRLRSYLFQLPVLAIATILCGTVSLTISLFEKSGRVQHRMAQFWARILVWNSGSTLTVYGAENFSKFPVAVIASNHTSYMDTPVLFSSLPFQFRILAKKELWPIPFIGWYLNRSGQIPIDTRTARGTIASLAGGVRALGRGMTLFVFPEGGRTRDGELQPFMSGAAYLAIRAQVPLVPLALTGVYDVLPIHTHTFFPGKMTLTVGEPIETTGMTTKQVDELNGQLREAITQLINERQVEQQPQVLTI